MTGHQLLRTFGANSFGRLIQALTQLVGVPLFLHAWGAVTYGEWLVLTAIPSYLLLSADLGLGTVATTEMTMQVGRGERAAALETLQSVWVLVCIGGLVFFALGSLVLYAFPFTSWLNVESIGVTEARGAVLLLLAAVLVGQQDQLVCAGIRCNGAFAAEAMSRALTALAEFGAVTAVLVTGGGPAAAAAAVLGARAGGVLAKRVYLARRFPWVRWGLRHARIGAARRLARPALSYLGLATNNALGSQGLVTVIGVVLGPLAVTTFATTRTVFNGVKQFLTLINASVWPELTRAFGCGERAEARRLHRFAVALAFWGGGAILAGLVAGGPALYQLWVGGEVAFHAPLFYALALAAFANTLWYASGVVPLAINRHGRLALVNLAGTITVLAVAFVLTRAWGLEAVAVSLAVVEAATAALVLRWSLRLLGDRLGPLAVAVGIAPARGWSVGTRLVSKGLALAPRER